MSEQSRPDSETSVRPFLPWVRGPLIFSGVCLTSFMCAGSLSVEWGERLIPVAFWGYAIGVIYFLIQGVGRLFLRQWRSAVNAFGRFILVGSGLLPTGFIMLIAMISRPDHFADNLTIPDNIEIAEVLPEPPCEKGEEFPQPRKYAPIGRPLRRNEHTLELADAGKGGIFITTFRINAGEPGIVFLKAYEVTRGTRLSEQRLADSRLRMPWSKNLMEVFTGEVRCSIGEGDSGKFYAARFEVWFKPDSGSPERKLAERVFKIEGYQRHGA